MPKDKVTMCQGFTLVELMVATVAGAIITFAVGMLLVSSQRGWQTMYSGINSGAMADSYIARKTFDAVVRKASREKLLLDDSGDWIEVYYYDDAASTTADCYARFYQADGNLNLEYGKVNPRETSTVLTVCRNVSDCVFKANGCSVQMVLTLDDGRQTATVVSSAVMHNE